MDTGSLYFKTLMSWDSSAVYFGQTVSLISGYVRSRQSAWGPTGYWLVVKLQFSAKIKSVVRQSI